MSLADALAAAAEKLGPCQVTVQRGKLAPADRAVFDAALADATPAIQLSQAMSDLQLYLSTVAITLHRAGDCQDHITAQ